MRLSNLGLLGLALVVFLAAGSLDRPGLTGGDFLLRYAKQQPVGPVIQRPAEKNDLALIAYELQRQIRSQRDGWEAMLRHEFERMSSPRPTADLFLEQEAWLWNQVWLAYQRRLAWESAQRIAQTYREIAGINSEIFWNRQRTMDRINRDFSEYLLGPSTWSSHREDGHRERRRPRY